MRLITLRKTYIIFSIGKIQDIAYCALFSVFKTLFMRSPYTGTGGVFALVIR